MAGGEWQRLDDDWKWLEKSPPLAISSLLFLPFPLKKIPSIGLTISIVNSFN